MGHTTRFYFRAKLNFRTPAAVKTVLQRQFAAAHLQPGPDWAGHGELSEPHLFFCLPRAYCIPCRTVGEPVRAPLFKQQADGGARLEFECEFKNYDSEIEQFLDWIAPFVRLRYGKRSRGRQRVWVGWYWPEEAEQRRNIFIEACETPENSGLLWGRRYYIDYGR